MSMLESLESRVLFTATAGQVAKAIHGFITDEGKLRVALGGLGNQVTKSQNLVTSDLAKLGVSSSQASLIQALQSADSTLTTSLNNSANTFSPVVNAEVSKLAGMLAQFRKNPTDSTLRQMINVEQTTLTVYAEESTAPFMANYNPPPGVIEALNPIVSANASSSKLAKDVKSVEKSIYKAMSKAYFAAIRVFDNDIGNYMALIDK